MEFQSCFLLSDKIKIIKIACTGLSVSTDERKKQEKRRGELVSTFSKIPQSEYYFTNQSLSKCQMSKRQKAQRKRCSHARPGLSMRAALVAGQNRQLGVCP